MITYIFICMLRITCNITEQKRRNCESPSLYLFPRRAVSARLSTMKMLCMLIKYIQYVILSRRLIETIITPRHALLNSPNTRNQNHPKKIKKSKNQSAVYNNASSAPKKQSNQNVHTHHKKSGAKLKRRVSPHPCIPSPLFTTP